MPSRNTVRSKRKPQVYVSNTKLPAFRKKNKPKLCPILKIPRFSPVVDHNHQSGMIRGVISLQANVLLGKVENCFRSRCSATCVDLPTALENLASYLRKGDSRFLHPKGATQLTNRFKYKPVKVQKATLRDLGAGYTDIKRCRNATQRAKLYRTLITCDTKNTKRTGKTALSASSARKGTG